MLSFLADAASFVPSAEEVTPDHFFLSMEVTSVHFEAQMSPQLLSVEASPAMKGFLSALHEEASSPYAVQELAAEVWKPPTQHSVAVSFGSPARRVPEAQDSHAVPLKA